MSDVIISLKYSLKDHMFTLQTEQASEVSYIIRYTPKHIDVEQALAGTGKADNNGKFTVTHLAGTESAGAKISHDVVKGALEVTAKAATGGVVKQQQNFVINAKGELQVTSSSRESQTDEQAGNVQGASTNSAELAVPGGNFRSESSETGVPSYQTTQNQVVMESTTEVNSGPGTDSPFAALSRSTMLPFGVFAVTLVLTIVSVALIGRRLRKAPVVNNVPPSTSFPQ